MSKKPTKIEATPVNTNTAVPRGKRPMIKCSDFNKSCLTFTKIDLANERSQQGISYPRYKYPKMDKESNLVYTTGEIKLTQYGLPSLKANMKNVKMKGWTGYENDKARGFIKVPIDPEQESCTEVAETLSAIDDVATDEKTKVSIFETSAKAKLFAYQPIIREPQEEEAVDEENDTKAKSGEKTEKKPKFKYFKVKLDREYGTDEILTKVFVKRKTDDGFELSQVNVKTETELEEYLTWGSTIRMIVLVNKLWADATKKTGATSKMYGITQKVIQLEIQPKETTGSVRSDLSSYAFDDDDVPVKQVSSKPSKVSQHVVQQADDEEEEQAEQEDQETVEQEEQEADEAEEQEAQEEEQEDEEEIEEVKPTKKGGKASVAREPSPKKTAPKKPTKNATSGK